MPDHDWNAIARDHIGSMIGRTPASLALELAMLRLSRQACLDALDAIRDNPEFGAGLPELAIHSGREMAASVAELIRRDQIRINAAMEAFNGEQ